MSDALSDILQRIRLDATVFSCAEMDAPWAVHTDGAVMGIFHAVVEGACWIKLEETSQVQRLEKGDIVFLPYGSAHILCDDLQTPVVPIRSLAVRREGRAVGEVRIRGFGEHTSVICGKFSFEQSDVHPLLSSLPKLLHYRHEDDESTAWVHSTMQLIRRELDATHPGSETVITRLTDVLLVYALRYYISSLPDHEQGWLLGLKDPQVGRALDLMHLAPEEKWTATGLARRVGMSRSAFFARFTELLGEPPQQYLTRWRMYLAARALRRGQHSMAEIAADVGYSSEAAFSKAFKRRVGLAPAHYRKRSRPEVAFEVEV